MLSKSSVPLAVVEVVASLQHAGHRAYLVGGCVRDLLRGAQPKDFDVATSATPEAVKRVFRRVIPTGIEHGTVTVVHGKTHVEVTTFRAEAEYLDGRRPSKVEFQEDVEADLGRRDFTMNAIAWDPEQGAVVDPFGGQADLRAGLVRCVRDPMERFSEDGLRPLRAVRFATVLGFTIEPATQAAIGQTLHVFAKVAQERVLQELEKMLHSPHVARGFQLLDQTGLLGAFLPEANRAELPALAHAPPDEVVRLGLVLWGQAGVRGALQRLKLPTKVIDEVAGLVEQRALPTSSAPAELRKWLAARGVDRAQRVVLAHQARGSIDPSLATAIAEVIAQQPPLTAKALALDGKGIMEALQTGPGPLVGQATRYLLDLVLEDPTRNTAEGLREALATFPTRFPT